MTVGVLDVSDADYYADPVPISLSKSIAHTLLTKSPAHAWLEHPRLGNAPKTSSKVMDEGQLIHTLLLGKGAKIAVVKADDYRTQAAKAVRDEAIARGELPVLEHVHEAALEATSRILKNVAAFGISTTSLGMPEVAFAWEEPGEDGPVQCRCKMDHVDVESGLIIDIKKTESARPFDAARAMIAYGSHVQDVAYRRALAAVRPDLAGRVDMLFLYVEVEPPYAVLPARASGMMREVGGMRWHRAVRVWEQCLRTGHWPGYANEPVQLEPPAWALTEEMAAS